MYPPVQEGSLGRLAAQELQPVSVVGYPRSSLLDSYRHSTMLCLTCENLDLPIVTSSQASKGFKLFASYRNLVASAKTCVLCHLIYISLQDFRLKGLKRTDIQLFSWASDALGDPIGMSRIFIRVGKESGRFIDVFAAESMLIRDLNHFSFHHVLILIMSR